MQSNWTATSRNPKTGNIPNQWIGKTKEETAESCGNCPLLPSKWRERVPTEAKQDSEAQCYAWSGAVQMALS